MGCSASVPAPAPAAEPEADAPVVPGAHVPQRMSMSELGRQPTSSSMGMHLCAPRRAKILFDVEAPRRVSMLAAMSPSSRGSSRKSINAGAIAPELKAMAEASKRRTT